MNNSEYVRHVLKDGKERPPMLELESEPEIVHVLHGGVSYLPQPIEIRLWEAMDDDQPREQRG